VEALSPETVTGVVRPWVQAGGRLVLSGPCGSRFDASRSHARVGSPAGMLPELCALAGLDPNAPRPDTHGAAVGRGQVVLLPPLGFDYYRQAPGERNLAAIEPAVRRHLAEHGLVAGGLPRELEVSVFRSPTEGRLFVDLANLDLDPDVDPQPRAHRVTVVLSEAPAGGTAEVLRPGEAPESVPVKLTDGRTAVGPVALGSYASVVIR